MRRTAPLLGIALLFVARAASATTYYVSNKGSDGADGASAGTAWRTMAKVNAAALQPGDSVLFERGGVFTGALTPTKSGATGKPITYGAYGSGAKPLLSGFTTISSWTGGTGNVWDAAVPNGGANLRSVVINGVLQPLGRYPKPNAPNAGYLAFASHSTAGALSSITDPQLPSNPNFAGGEIVLRMVHWLEYRTPITSHVGTTLSFATIAAVGTYPLVDGSGYFVQNARGTLTANGDWYYDATTKKVGLYYTGSAPPAKVPTIDRLVSFTNRSYLSFTDLAFEGSNSEAIFGDTSSFIEIKGCDFDLAGTYAINLNYAGNVVIDGNTIKRSVSDGIFVRSPTLTDVTITNNTIEDSGLVIGMSQGERNSNEAIDLTVKSGAKIENNTIKNTGFVPIRFTGNDISIKNNVIDGFCSVLDDGGAIYTWNGPANVFSNRVVANNVITNGIGAAAGTISGKTQANGIYLDNNTNNVEVTGNSVYHLSDDGMHLNSPQDITVKKNNFFDIDRGWSVGRWVADGSTGGNGGQDVKNAAINDNVFAARTANQTSFEYIDRGVSFPTASTVQARLLAMGSIGGNFYYAQNTLPFDESHRDDKSSPFVYPPPQSFDQWKAFTGIEAASVMLPAQPTYTIQGTVGSNLYQNGTFEAGIVGVSGYTSPTNHTLVWDKSSKLDGVGSLAVGFNSPPTNPRDVVLIYAPIGPVSSTKKYLLKVSTLGTSDAGIIRASFRKTNANFGALSPIQMQPFGKARVDHQFVIDAPTTDAAASWQIDVLQSAGTTYLDSISVTEVDATATNPDDYVRFEVATQAAKTVTLDRTYVDARGTAYCGTTTLAPFTSIVLFASSVPCTPPPPPDGGTTDGGGYDDGGTRGIDPTDESGCGCVVGPSSNVAWPAGLLTALVAAMALVRRRRR
jgi:MYXO-CTERM domain-containing protein